VLWQQGKLCENDKSQSRTGRDTKINIINKFYIAVTISKIKKFLICRFRVFMKRHVMCNNEDSTSKPPIGVARLVTAPLIVMTAVPHPEPIPLTH